MTRSSTELAAAHMVLPVYGMGAFEATAEQRSANRSIYHVETAAEVISKFRPAGLLLVERIPFHAGFADVGLGMLDTTERLRSFVEGVQEVARSEQMEPLLIVADEEGGAGSRLPSAALPAPAAIGRTEDTAMAEEAGRLTSRAASAHGVGVVLGPLADLGMGNAAIGDRAFSADPNLVAEMAAAWVRGVQETEILAVAKHWPGHGRASADSHVSVPALDVDASVWEREERVPFAAAVDNAVAGVLVAHLRAPSIDSSGALASQSSVLTSKLRDELAFTGFTMTDALWMPSARQSAPSDAEVAIASLNAGIDILLAPPDPKATCALIETHPQLSESSQASHDRIAEARSAHPTVDRTIDIDELNADISEFNTSLEERFRRGH